MGTVPIAIKAVSANPWVIGLIRLSVATACTLVFLRASHDLRKRSAAELRVLVLIGVIFSLHWATYFIGIKMTTPSAAAIGAATYGVHLSIMGRIMLRQAPSLVQWISLLLAFAGTSLVVDSFSFRDTATAGFALTVFAAFINAFLPILHQRHAAIPVDVRTLAQYLFALPLFLIMLPKMDWNLTGNDWLGLIHLGIFATFVAHTLWIRGATVLPTHVSGLIFYLYVPLTMMFSSIWFGEAIGWSKIAGAALIVGASCLGILSQRAPRATLDGNSSDG
jgi:drug/metabolite transporter (DMT)-like permease